MQKGKRRPCISPPTPTQRISRLLPACRSNSSNVIISQRFGCSGSAMAANIILALLLLSFLHMPASMTVDPSAVLLKFPSLSTFNTLLKETGVAEQIAQRSSITVLVPDNVALDPVVRSSANNTAKVADILRYHCLLMYLDMQELRSITNPGGVLLATLYQATGRASGNLGFINVTVARTGAIHLGVPVRGANYSAAVISNITQFPYDISFLQIDRVLIPQGIGSQGGAATGIANLTATLQNAGNFGVFLGLINSTGVAQALASLSAVTLLVPPDSAFNALPSKVLNSLSKAQTLALLQYHAIPNYYTIASLVSAVGPISTVATQSAGTGKYVLDIFRGSPTSQQQREFSTRAQTSVSSVTFDTGVNKATVQTTVVDHPPVIAYSINRVLLPSEIFTVVGAAGAPIGAPSPALSPAAAIAPILAPPNKAPVGEPAAPVMVPPPVPASQAPQASQQGGTTPTSSASYTGFDFLKLTMASAVYSLFLLL